MRVDGRVPVLVEIAVPAHCLPEQAAIPEMNATPETDTIPGTAFLHHPCRKLIQEKSRLLQFLLGKGPEDLF